MVVVVPQPVGAALLSAAAVLVAVGAAAAVEVGGKLPKANGLAPPIAVVVVVGSVFAVPLPKLNAQRISTGIP